MKDGRSCFLLPLFFSVREERVNAFCVLPSFTWFHAPVSGVCEGERDTGDALRAFCVYAWDLRGRRWGLGRLGGEPAPRGTQICYRTPRASTQAAHVIGWGQLFFSFLLSFTPLFGLFSVFFFRGTNNYKHEHAYAPCHKPINQKVML